MRTYEITLRIIETRKVTVEAEGFLTQEEAHAAAVQQEQLQGANTQLYFSRDITPPVRKFKERVNAAFKAIRKGGGIARMNYHCCQSCAWAALETDYPNVTEESTVVFYHRQDAEAFDGKNLAKYAEWVDGERTMRECKLFLAWSGDGVAITQALEAEGLMVEWNGSKNTRIAVTGVKEGVA